MKKHGLFSLFNKARLLPFLIALLPFLVLFSFLYAQDLKQLLSLQGRQGSRRNYKVDDQPSPPQPGMMKKKKGVGEAGAEECNVFAGRWVRDEETHPLYQESDCPYIKPWMACEAGGRPDKEYRYWRWQPHDCILPSFNATMMLEALRGKRMMFVGDSLGYGQFTSMVCLLQSAVPIASQAYWQDHNDSHTVFSAKNYNTTVEFYWAPLLLESNCDNATFHRITNRIVRRSINKHGKFWKGVDILVLDTFIWWMASGDKFKILQGSFEDRVKKIVWVPTLKAYSMAIKEMLQWVRKNMDQNKTRVFFTSMSPTHQLSEDWGDAPGSRCNNQTTMIEDPNYWSSEDPTSIMRVTGEILGKTDVPVTFLNITQLSMYRKDAHMSIYKKLPKPMILAPEQLSEMRRKADCIHWCLPGVQDTWNELLFAKLLYHPLKKKKKKNSSNP